MWPSSSRLAARARVGRPTTGGGGGGGGDGAFDSKTPRAPSPAPRLAHHTTLSAYVNDHRLASSSPSIDTLSLFLRAPPRRVTTQIARLRRESPPKRRRARKGAEAPPPARPCAILRGFCCRTGSRLRAPPRLSAREGQEAAPAKRRPQKRRRKRQCAAPCSPAGERLLLPLQPPRWRRWRPAACAARSARPP